MYYEEEWEDEESYEDYCHLCGHRWEHCYCLPEDYEDVTDSELPAGDDESATCNCGGLLDVGSGLCPHCEKQDYWNHLPFE